MLHNLHLAWYSANKEKSWPVMLLWHYHLYMRDIKYCENYINDGTVRITQRENCTDMGHKWFSASLDILLCLPIKRPLGWQYRYSYSSIEVMIEFCQKLKEYTCSSNTFSVCIAKDCDIFKTLLCKIKYRAHTKYTSSIMETP